MDKLYDFIENSIDFEKVEKYRDLIEKGEYIVDNETLAEKIINDQMAWDDIISSEWDL